MKLLFIYWSVRLKPLGNYTKMHYLDEIISKQCPGVLHGPLLYQSIHKYQRLSHKLYKFLINMMPCRCVAFLFQKCTNKEEAIVNKIKTCQLSIIVNVHNVASWKRAVTLTWGNIVANGVTTKKPLQGQMKSSRGNFDIGLFSTLS